MSGASGEKPSTPPPPPVRPGDVARLRKAHPCGGRAWRVTRIGADIGLECLTCGRRVMLTRDEFERRCVSREPAPAGGVE